MSKNKPQVIANADSKGVMLDYFQLSSSPMAQGVMGRTPRTDPSVILKVVRNDPVVRGTIIKIVDKVVESGWRVQSLDGNQKSRKKELEAALRSVRYDRVLRKVVFNLAMYNNAFVEIRTRSGKLHDLNVLENQWMRIDTDDHGNVLGYYQEVGSAAVGKNPYWPPEEIIHYKLDDFTSNAWSEMNIEAIYETVLIKDYARQILLWLMGSNQFRPVLSVENTGSAKMKELLAYLKAAESHVRKPIPVEGKLTVTPLQDPGIVQWILVVISWCNTEIHKLLQVPEIAVGTSDNGGRADGAEQREYLNTRVFNIHRLIEDDNTYDLFPKIGFGKNEFVFGILDETVRTRVFENVQTMRNSNFTVEAIAEYLDSQGIVFETDKPLLTLEEISIAAAAGTPDPMGVQTGNEGSVGKKSADAAPSRQRQNSQDVSKGNRKVSTV